MKRYKVPKFRQEKFRKCADKEKTERFTFDTAESLAAEPENEYRCTHITLSYFVFRRDGSDATLFLHERFETQQQCFGVLPIEQKCHHDIVEPCVDQQLGRRMYPDAPSLRGKELVRRTLRLRFCES